MTSDISQSGMAQDTAGTHRRGTGRRVHSMTGGLAVLDAPAIALAELESLAPLAPVLCPPLQVTWLSPRPFAAAARVQTGRGMVFVKRHDLRVRNVEALLEEHRFIAHLRAQGAAVPEVLAADPRAAGAPTAIATQRWSYEFHAPATGLDLYADVHSWDPVRNTAHAAALGGALARLHRAAVGYGAPARRPRPLLAAFDVVGASDLAAALEAFLARRPAVAHFLQQQGPTPAAIGAALAPWHAALRPWLAQLAPLWVHNDWHASNAFWSEPGEPTRVTCAIDFGLCNLGCAVADLATALERNTVAWLERPLVPDAQEAPQIGRADLAEALLRGYLAQRPLAPAERAALPLLLGLAHVEFALSEVDYFHGVVGNDADAQLACPDFLLGHPAWFESAPGRAYVERICAILQVPLPDLWHATASARSGAR
jgi:Ser/Thr protein kinase RdoA (MazF antagonist)